MSIDKKKLNHEVLKYWVLKEASIKWQQGKLVEDIQKWEVSVSKINQYIQDFLHHLILNFWNSKNGI